MKEVLDGARELTFLTISQVKLLLETAAFAHEERPGVSRLEWAFSSPSS